MSVFTTNWYLYKTHFKENPRNLTTQNSRTLTEFYRTEKVTALKILREMDDEF
jgi:hypothetical protein